MTLTSTGRGDLEGNAPRLPLADVRRIRAEAAAAGLSTFDLPWPCGRGHWAPRLVRGRLCVECAAMNAAERKTERARAAVPRPALEPAQAAQREAQEAKRAAQAREAAARQAARTRKRAAKEAAKQAERDAKRAQREAARQARAKERARAKAAATRAAKKLLGAADPQAPADRA